MNRALKQCRTTERERRLYGYLLAFAGEVREIAESMPRRMRHSVAVELIDLGEQMREAAAGAELAIASHITKHAERHASELAVQIIRTNQETTS